MPIITQSVADVARTLSQAAQTGQSVKVSDSGKVKSTGWFRSDNHQAIIRSVVQIATQEGATAQMVAEFAGAIADQTHNVRGFATDFNEAARILRFQEHENIPRPDPTDNLPLGAENFDTWAEELTNRPPPVPPHANTPPVPPKRFESLAASLVKENEPQAVPAGMFDDPIYGTAPQTTKGTEDTWNHFRSGIQQSGLMSQARPAGPDVDTVQNPQFQEAPIEEWLNMRMGPGAEPPTFPIEDTETIANPDYESSVESVDMDAIMSDVLRNRGQ